MVSFYSAIRNQVNLGVIGITLDSQNVANGANYAEIYLADDATAAFRPTFTVNYSLNRPVFTDIGNPLLAAIHVPYLYLPTADPYLLGDQTSGNFIDLVWTLEGVEGVDFPTGMTIVPSTGRVDWLPQGYQAESNDFTVRTTNAGGIFVQRLHDVFVLSLSPGQIQVDGLAATPDAQAVTAAAQAQAIAAAAQAQDVTAATTAQAIAVETTTQRVSVTVEPASIVVEPD
jgi:hypothetical protein